MRGKKQNGPTGFLGWFGLGQVKREKGMGRTGGWVRWVWVWAGLRVWVFFFLLFSFLNLIQAKFEFKFEFEFKPHSNAPA